MLTRVKSFMFSLRCVEVRVSTIALALNSYRRTIFSDLFLISEGSHLLHPEVAGMKRDIFGTNLSSV